MRYLYEDRNNTLIECVSNEENEEPFKKHKRKR
jgi:hypothetical protein